MAESEGINNTTIIGIGIIMFFVIVGIFYLFLKK
jgi:hypothetical protein